MTKFLLSATMVLLLTLSALAQGGSYEGFDNTASPGNPASITIDGDIILITVTDGDNTHLFVGIILHWAWDADLEMWFADEVILDTWINGKRPDSWEDGLDGVDISTNPAVGGISIDWWTNTPQGLTVPGGGNYGIAGTKT